MGHCGVRTAQDLSNSWVSVNDMRTEHMQA